MSYFDQDVREMLDVFLLETGQLIEKLDEILLESEKRRKLAEDEINSIFRIMHTVKSSAAMMGLDELSGIAHRLEDIFSALRDKKEASGDAPEGFFEILFAVSDCIRAEMGRMKDEDYQPSGMDGIAEKIETFLTADEEVRTDAPGDVPVPRMAGPVLKVEFQPDCRMENIRAFMLMRRVREICPQAVCLPEKLENNPDAAGRIRENGFLVQVPETQLKEVYETLCGGVFVKKCELVMRPAGDSGIMAETKKETKAESEAKGESATKAEAKEERIPVSDAAPAGDSEFMDVRTERLDHLQNLAGELIVLMSAFSGELKERGQMDMEERFGRPVRQLVEELGSMVLGMRMVPIRKIVPKLKRVLRNICRDQQKEVEFIVSGQETEADKNIVDELYEASMHIIRNSVDHGIEMPGERRSCGKPEQGTIQYKVESAGDELIVSICDDGRGMDLDGIREQARRKNLFERPEEEYTDEEIYEFTTMPGFTTNHEVNEYSGRGVGMDIVKRLTEDASGHLRIQSAKGKGTAVTLYLPLTRAIIESILFRAGGNLFSVPFRQIVQFIDWSVDNPNIRRENGRCLFISGNKALPVIDIAEVYGTQSQADGKIMLHVKGPVMEVCILVDEVVSQEKLVLKPLPKLLGAKFKEQSGMTGCCILGDGKICMALDIESFVQSAQKKNADRRKACDGK